MGEQVRVESVDALLRFRAALCKFADAARADTPLNCESVPRCRGAGLYGFGKALALPIVIPFDFAQGKL